ncbi:carboxypeptidase-like regulatory domain-containing protein [uncultured Kordia sp.]|uniref:carboxypeptidase-like regulatory domain-containing protein n=1 Tax=uncultured Kordia sp. TaxID=507699 RepID=UPI0026368714|nr:carboxypeptidase-like regulatory domain-containing protein [uncultured Kordia sp.]
MRRIQFILIIFISNLSFSQISGNLTNSKTGAPIVFANVWVKNSLKGSTTDGDGNFELEKGKVGDTLLVSYLGYEKIEFLAKKRNIIKLDPQEIQLDEVVITKAKNTKTISLSSYKDYNDINMFYLNGHYSFARFYEYKKEYKQNTFVKKISLVTASSLEKVKFRVHLIEADKDGNPTDRRLSSYIILETNSGKNEITIDVSDKELLFPENGLFIVVDRLNLKQNIFNSKYMSNVLEPGIGMEKRSKEKNTWLSYGGKWIQPKQLKKFAKKNKNIALNIELSN